MLREQGDIEGAEIMRTRDLADVITAIRTTLAEHEIDVDERIGTIFAAEQERVANAAVLAELLAPLLERRLAGRLHAGDRGATTASGDGQHGEVAPERREANPPSRPSATDIAGFIDDMLAQERADGLPKRRAS